MNRDVCEHLNPVNLPCEKCQSASVQKSTLREAAQQALEALMDDCLVKVGPHSWERRSDLAITALKNALAEPVQEPVAWRTFDGEGGYDYWAYEDNENYHEEYVKRNGEKYASWVEPLYTAPPQRKPLTEEEIDELSRTMVKGDRSVNWLCRAIERAHGIGEKE